MQTYRRNLGRNIDALLDLKDAGLNGTLEVDVVDLFAQVCLGADETDETVLDSQENIRALLNLLPDSTLGLDDEFLATASKWSVRLSTVISM